MAGAHSAQRDGQFAETRSVDYVREVTTRRGPAHGRTTTSIVEAAARNRREQRWMARTGSSLKATTCAGADGPPRGRSIGMASLHRELILAVHFESFFTDRVECSIAGFVDTNLGSNITIVDRASRHSHNSLSQRA